MTKHYEAFRKYVETFAKLRDKSPVAPYSTGADDANKFAHSPDVADFSKFDPLKPVYYEQPGPDLFQSQYLRNGGWKHMGLESNCPRFLPSGRELKTLFQLDQNLLL